MYLGIDLGTSGVKAILMDDNQQFIASHTELLAIKRPHPLWSEQDPHEWWCAVDKSILQLKKQFDLKQVKAIGLSGQMHSATLLDKQHKVLRPAILWNDNRTVIECDELTQLFPDVQKITGSLIMTSFTAPKLKWLQKNEHNLFKQIDKILLPKDYLRFCMTGEFATDMSDASGTMWLNVEKRDWSTELLSACDVTEQQMPKLYEGTEVTGILMTSIAQRWGMNTVPVVAGGGDNAAGAIGVGLYQQGQSMLSLGTSGVYFMVIDSFLINQRQIVHSFCHATPKKWCLMSSMLSAASCLTWACKALNIASVSELFQKVEQTKPNGDPIYFLPYLSGERAPHNNPHARGMFFGLTHQHTSIDLARAVLEGVSFGLADCMDVLHQTGVMPTQIYLIGGGARSVFWGQLLSNISGHSLIYSEGGSVGPALGAAKLAQIAVNPQLTLTQILQPPKILRTYTPDDAEYQYYRPRRERFNQIYQQIKPLWQQE